MPIRPTIVLLTAALFFPGYSAAAPTEPVYVDDEEEGWGDEDEEEGWGEEGFLPKTISRGGRKVIGPRFYYHVEIYGHVEICGQNGQNSYFHTEIIIVIINCIY